MEWITEPAPTSDEKRSSMCSYSSCAVVSFVVVCPVECRGHNEECDRRLIAELVQKVDKGVVSVF